MAEWDRQEGEPERWFARFERFRMMGSGRTLLGCVRAEEAQSGKKKHSAAPPGAWSQAADKWQWRKRAEAWDASQLQKAREAEEDALAERRKAWIAQAMAIQGVGSQGLLALNADELAPRDVLAFLADGLKLEMLVRGEPTDTHEHIISTPEQQRTRVLGILARLRDRSGTAGA